MVEMMPTDDRYRQVAGKATILNVGCSFYSISGQPREGDVTPSQQFLDREKPGLTYIGSAKG
jgi:hypothetical protein